MISGDSSSAQVDINQIRLASFDDDSTGPPAFPCSRDGALVDEGTAAPKPCLPPAEMRTPTAAGGLLPAGTASRAMKTFFSRPTPSSTLGEEAREITSRTKNNQLAPSYWSKVIQTKLRQTLVFDLGGCRGRVRSCPFLGGRHALRVGWARLDAAIVAETGAFLVHVKILSR